MKSVWVLTIVLAFAAGSVLTGAMAYAAPNGEPFQALLDAIDNLQGQIDDIELTQGPTGATGPQGEQGVPGMTTEEFQELVDRINELTSLHYPEGSEIPTVTPPELVPIPEFPEPGENPEFAPDQIPYELLVRVPGGNCPDVDSTNCHVQIQYRIDLPDQFPRGEEEPFTKYEISTDGSTWTEVELDKFDTTFNVGGLNAYEEVLFRVAQYNEFGSGPWSTVASGVIVSGAFGDAETGRVDAHKVSDDGSGVELRWNAVYWTFGFDRINTVLERSTNYGTFEVLEANLGTDQSATYLDTDVIDGNIYSYRVQTTTTNEIHPRSGFVSVLYE